MRVVKRRRVFLTVASDGVSLNVVKGVMNVIFTAVVLV